MKTIEVVAAIIREGDRVLATQRGYGEFEGMWEFPGGKIEPGEECVEYIGHAMRVMEAGRTMERDGLGFF